jgi:tetratricopeptide (TPR) repeat protein
MALDESAEAEEHFLEAIQMFPSHAGSVRSLIEILHAGADYAGVVEVFEKYTSATRVHVFELVAGDGTVWGRIPADGRGHEVRLPLTTLDLTNPVEIRSSYPTFEVTGVGWEAGFRAGSTAREAGAVEPLAGQGGGRAQLPPDAAIALLTVRVGIPFDQATWSLVEAAYRNLLRIDEARAVFSRLQLISPEAWETADLEP